MPFGVDLDILLSTTGFMTLEHGWRGYACKQMLLDTLWEEFFAVAGIEGGENRRKTRGLAEVSGRIGAILRLAFRRNVDGSPSEEVKLSETSIKQLRAWFGE